MGGCAVSPVLEIKGLTVTLKRGGWDVPVLERFDLAIAPGEMLGLVGESGSGKTIAALAVMGLLPEGGRVAGRILLDGEDLVQAGAARLRALRGKAMAMVFQNSLAALNPSRTVAAQIGEAWRVHEGGGRAAARGRALALLEEVGIADAARRLDDYPHQFSGGQRQRVMIAMALACSPKLLIADEPTTGLDPLIAKQIMALIEKLRRERNMAVLFVTHDLSVVRDHAEAIQVLYAGRAVESGRAAAFFAGPRHPYAEALLGAVPRLGQRRLRAIPGQLPEPEARPAGCYFAPRCAYARAPCEAEPPPSRDGVACLYPLAAGAALPEEEPPVLGAARAFMPLLEVRDLSVKYGRAAALEGVSLALGRGECLGVVGESGSGKSSFGRAVLQMLDYEGQVVLDGQNFTRLRGAARRVLRRKIQMVFQDPRESMNPRMSVGEVVAEPLVLQGGLGREEMRARVAALLGQVGLNAALAGHYPAGISGGQAQRVAIARALAAGPELIVLDEPTSALDVSTQAMLLNLLKDLAFKHALSYILISHDFAVVSYMADRIAVLKSGRVVEMGETAALIAAPQSPYTAALIGAAPRLDGQERPCCPAGPMRLEGPGKDP